MYIIKEYKRILGVFQPVSICGEYPSYQDAQDARDYLDNMDSDAGIEPGKYQRVIFEKN